MREDKAVRQCEPARTNGVGRATFTGFSLRLSGKSCPLAPLPVAAERLCGKVSDDEILSGFQKQVNGTPISPLLLGWLLQLDVVGLCICSTGLV